MLLTNIFDIEVDNDVEYTPVITEDFRPTNAVPGTLAKLEVLSRRFCNSNPLWHPSDRNDLKGLCGACLRQGD